MNRAALVAVLLLSCSESAKPPEAPTSPSSSATSSATPAPAPSPSPSPTSTGASTSCEGPSPGPGYECIQACGPPVSRAGDPPPPYVWLSPDDLRRRKIGGCPRCLHRGTRIATPGGDVPVERLHVGDPIWTTSSDGRRVASTVLRTSWTPAPRDHRMLRIRLADGRTFVASPGHPTAEGGALDTLASLTTGAPLDHGRVVTVETTTLEDDRTFDVRPDGETGRYWAEGVLLGSTLSR